MENMKSLQKLVYELVEKHNLEISPELRYLDLTSEVGEVGKELLKGSNYGKEEFQKTDNLELELGDTFFSLICIANSLNLDLEKALLKVLEKYQNRFSEKGSIGSEKVKKSNN